MILLIGLIPLSNCKKCDPVIIPQQEIYCPKPEKPTLINLNNESDIYNNESIKILLNNLNNLVDYSLKQDETIKCYEKSNSKDKK